MKIFRLFLVAIASLALACETFGAGQTSTEVWKPVPGHIQSVFAKAVSPENVWPEYPRPQMERTEWQSLNGLWDYAIIGESQEWQGGYVENARFDPLKKSTPSFPAKYDGKILVPYCPESSLSGVGKLVRPNQLLWYRRTFSVPSAWSGKRLLLHFEAVDWHSIVWVNGSKVGENQGGYIPFCCDITEATKASSGLQEITVAVWDPSNMGNQAVGKQALPEQKKGYRYTPTTGIWQPVWIEPVSATSIDHLKLTPDVDQHRLILETHLRGSSNDCLVDARIFAKGKLVAGAVGSPNQPLAIAIPRVKLWSPESPFLYDVKVSLKRADQTLDQVSSYCGMRTITVQPTQTGEQQVRLNNQPIFQFGPLDQGYWPESLLTPPSDAAAKFDVQYLRDIGCNMARVHIKVHPRRWYYWADKLGLLVWQDFPCTRKFDPSITKESAAQWEQEQEHLMDHLHNHPSIITWVVFNEGWGQYDTVRLASWTMRRDPSRLVNNASGWTDAGLGHFYDAHDYSFHPAIPAPGQITNRTVVLGECGGFNLVRPGHTWEKYPVQNVIDPLGDSGREHYPNAQSWLPRYEAWIEDLRLLKSLGMTAAVYTQISDVEHECNGWLTYDRAESKLPRAKLKKIHTQLYAKPPVLKPLLPMLAGPNAASRFTTGPVATNWMQPEFDDSGWQPAQGTQCSKVGANTNGIMLRRTFDLERLPKRAALQVTLQGAAEFYLNGTLVKSLRAYDLAGFAPASAVMLSAEAMKQLRPGRNVLAIEVLPTKTHLSGTNQPILLNAAILEAK